MTAPGSATVRRAADGSVVVDHADDVIAVAHELLYELYEGASCVDGVLTLDPPGQYRYRRRGPSPDQPGVDLFDRIHDTETEPT